MNWNSNTGKGKSGNDNQNAFPDMCGFSSKSTFPGNGAFQADNRFPGAENVGQQGSSFDSLRMGSIDDNGSQPQTITRWNKAAMVTGLLGGLIGTVLAILLHSTVLVRILPPESHVTMLNILTIATLLALTGLFAQIGLALYAAIWPQRLKLQRGWSARLICLVLALFLVGALMQFLYGLGGTRKATSADDFVLLIDDSGSMSQTDPGRQRVAASETLVQKLDTSNRIAMAFFVDDIIFSLPMEPVTSQKREQIRSAVSQLRSNGNTDINAALNYALTLSHDNPQRVTDVILLTDGESYDVDVHFLSESYRARNMRLSAIVLNSGLRNHSIKKLVAMTGGKLYGVDQLDDLIGVYGKVGFITYDRDLLGLRNYMDHDNLLLGALRIISWLIFGLIMGFGMILLLDQDPQLPLFLAGPMFGLLLGILLEALNVLWIDGSLRGMNAKAFLTPLLCVAILFFNIPANNIPYYTANPQTYRNANDNKTTEELNGKDKEKGIDILGKW